MIHQQAKLKKTECIPQEWKTSPLSVLCKNITDGKHGDCENEYNSGYFFISAKDIFDGKLNYEHSRQITRSDFLDAHKRTKVESGDILLTNSGSIGKLAIVEDIFNTARTTFQKSVALLKPETDKISTKFLYYYLYSNQKQLEAIASGSSQKNLLLRQIAELKIILPSFREQQKIASILSKVDGLIQKTGQIIEQTQRLKKGLMQRLLTKGIGHKKFWDTEVGKIPDIWRVSTIGQEFDVGSGGTPSRRNPEYFSGDIPWVKTTELDFNRIVDTEERITNDAIRNSSTKIYPEGTFVIAMIGLEAGKTMGRCAILGVDAAVNQACASLQTHGNVTIPFIFYYYQTLKKKIMSLMAGTKRMNLNLELVKSIQIPTPPIDEQNKITSILQRADKLIEKNYAHRQEIKILKKGLMQNLLTGKIRVKV